MTIALILNSRLPYRNVLSGIMLLPWIVPEIVTALTWKSIYDPLFGSLNPILLGAGIIDRPQGWLSDPEPRHALDHRGERLEGNTLLRSPASRRARRRSIASSSRRPRSTAPASCSGSAT